MIVIGQALLRVLCTVNGVKVLKQFAMFCGAVLLVSLLMATYGLDLSPGFF